MPASGSITVTKGIATCYLAQTSATEPNTGEEGGRITEIGLGQPQPISSLRIEGWSHLHPNLLGCVWACWMLEKSWGFIRRREKGNGTEWAIKVKLQALIKEEVMPDAVRISEGWCRCQAEAL